MHFTVCAKAMTFDGDCASFKVQLLVSMTRCRLPSQPIGTLKQLQIATGQGPSQTTSVALQDLRSDTALGVCAKSGHHLSTKTSRRQSSSMRFYPLCAIAAARGRVTTFVGDTAVTDARAPEPTSCQVYASLRPVGCLPYAGLCRRPWDLRSDGDQSTRTSACRQTDSGTSIPGSSLCGLQEQPGAVRSFLNR